MGEEKERVMNPVVCERLQPSEGGSRLEELQVFQLYR